MTTKLKKRTVNLLRKVQAHILEEPKRLDMSDWGVAYATGTKTRIEGTTDKEVPVPACNTVGCVAGWSIFLGRPKLWKDLIKATAENKAIYDNEDTALDETLNSPKYEAERILGITDEQGERLFFFKKWSFRNPLSGWPEKFSDAYKKAKTAKQRAKVTAARIDRFIDTDGAE